MEDEFVLANPVGVRGYGGRVGCINDRTYFCTSDKSVIS